MKATLVLLAFSLLTNTFLVSTHRGRLPARTDQPVVIGADRERSPGLGIAVAKEGSEPLLAAFLKGDDPKALDQELRRLELPKERREALLRAFVNVRMQLRYLPRQPASPEPVPYWKKAKSRADFDPRAYQEAREAELAALGLSEGSSRNGGETVTRSYAFLGEEKNRLLSRVEKDYAEMFTAVRRQAEGFWLKSDSARMDLLRKERATDMDAVLTAQDKEQIALRESYQAYEVRQDYGEVVASEDEFLRLYRLRCAREESLAKARGIKDDVEQSRLQAQAEASYDAGVRAVLGDARLAELEQANDPDKELIKAASARLGLGPEAEPRLSALRVSALAEYKGIAGNPHLRPEERLRALSRLKARVSGEARSVLGGEGGEAYLERVSWMRRITLGE